VSIASIYRKGSSLGWCAQAWLQAQCGILSFQPKSFKSEVLVTTRRQEFNMWLNLDFSPKMLNISRFYQALVLQIGDMLWGKSFGMW
jgi:hypothetical protein